MSEKTRMFKYGAEVTWVHVVYRGSGMRLTTKRGKCVGFRGEWVDVLMKNGRVVLVEAKDLRHANEKTVVAEAFEQIEKAVATAQQTQGAGGSHE